MEWRLEHLEGAWRALPGGECSAAGGSLAHVGADGRHVVAIGNPRQLALGAELLRRLPALLAEAGRTDDLQFSAEAACEAVGVAEERIEALEAELTGARREEEMLRQTLSAFTAPPRRS